jgi:hypothetical protein
MGSRRFVKATGLPSGGLRLAEFIVASPVNVQPRRILRIVITTSSVAQFSIEKSLRLSRYSKCFVRWRVMAQPATWDEGRKFYPT